MATAESPRPPVADLDDAPAAADDAEREPGDDGGRAPATPDFICFCGVDWWYHSRAHSDLQLMTRVAADAKVLLINSIGMRMPRPGKSAKVGQKVWRKLKSIAKFVRRPLADRPGFWVMSPIVLPFYGSPRLRALNARLVRAQVRVVARLLGIREPVLFVTVPTAFDVVEPMRRRALVYNRSDKHSEFAEADTTLIRQLENRLLTRADVVLYVSRTLRDDERDRTGDRAKLLEHGVDLDRFVLAPTGGEPSDVAAIPHPRIGFFGGLRTSLVDVELLERLADALPDAQLVLVGDAPSEVADLLARPNVHWLGPKDHAQIPAYGAAFDVGLMPYRRNEWIRNCNPIKLKEYLALGLPVVSTDFPAAREYDGTILVAEDADEFVHLTRRAADAARDETESTRAARRALVDGSSWDAKTRELVALCTGDAVARRGGG